MNESTGPRPLIVAPYSDVGFAITSWGERARPRLRRAQTGGQLVSDVPEIAEAASAAGMDILGPPLNDEEVAAIARGSEIGPRIA